MARSTQVSRKTFLSYFDELIHDMQECDDVDLRGSVRLGPKKVRVPAPMLTLQLLLGGEDGYRLHMDPEMVIDARGRFHASGDYLLFDPQTFFNGISGFVRLAEGASLTLGRESLLQRLLLDYPKVVAEQHLRLKLNDNGLSLKRKSSKRDACVAPVKDKDLIDRMVRWRKRKIERLAKLLGSPIECPSRSEGLALLEQVIALMGREPYRPQARDGRPGSLLQLPGRPAPIFVGDLHARIDNLLVILTQNGFLESLQDGSGMLILVGDAVHPDEPGREDEMDMSMLLMDLIFRLKLLFPERVFYLRGNHDSFSEDVNKGGVPQGLLWEKALHDRRGAEYRDAMQRLYDVLPYIAVSPQFICCHAGAPTMSVSRDDLINAHEKPALQHQLTHLRLRNANMPGGYARGDVKRLRKRLGADEDTPLVVGHTPLSADDTYWLNAGGIEHHHVLFGANPKTVGVITRTGRHLVPLKYPAEPLLDVYNRLIHTGTMTE
ncbi:MAG: metallophosphoesterase [Thiohalocapsa sp.]|nr:metallophosphoesterase [Thiohalocapsa sp.]MCF7992469.1 metallophosphoesterase [Thiohalocapsa sp.]